jgi:hypothetical protein
MAAQRLVECGNHSLPFGESPTPARRRRRAISDIEPSTRDAESKGSLSAKPERAYRLGPPTCTPPRTKRAAGAPRFAPRENGPSATLASAKGFGEDRTGASGQSVRRRGEPVVSGESGPPPVENAHVSDRRFTRPESGPSIPETASLTPSFSDS